MKPERLPPPLPPLPPFASTTPLPSPSALPTVRGRYQFDVPLAPLSWFRVGGKADVVFKPADPLDLAQFMAERPLELPITILGATSNLLIRDGGIRGVVIRLGRGFAEVVRDGRDETMITAGAACLDRTVAQQAAEWGLAGMEFLVGVPGSIGGALRMNAGAYGQELADICVSAEICDNQGNLMSVPGEQLGFGYRHCLVSPRDVFIGCRLRGRLDDSAAVMARMQDIVDQREQTQPIRARTGGSTFQNPTPEQSPLKAWQLIDQAGCRGLTLGGAQVSPLHCNFLLNTGNATASDLEQLGELVRQRVLESSGVQLHWEIKRVGENLPATYSKA